VFYGTRQIGGFFVSGVRRRPIAARPCGGAEDHAVARRKSRFADAVIRDLYPGARWRVSLACPAMRHALLPDDRLQGFSSALSSLSDEANSYERVESVLMHYDAVIVATPKDQVDQVHDDMHRLMHAKGLSRRPPANWGSDRRHGHQGGTEAIRRAFHLAMQAHYSHCFAIFFTVFTVASLIAFLSSFPAARGFVSALTP
jgi:hypothetical protein